MIAGKTLQATVSEHNWLTLVADSGASKTFASHKSDSAELHLSNGSVADGIAAGCSIRGGEFVSLPWSLRKAPRSL